MNYSSLFLSNESIQRVFKDKQQKRIGRGFASLVKLGVKNDFAEECEKCDYKTPIAGYMYKHNRIKHSDIKHKCTECNFTHTFPTKVRTHHRHVHLGVPRKRKQQKCGKSICKDVGKSDCKEKHHFLFFCSQCEFSTTRNDSLKIHTRRVHEGLGTFPCSQCDFSSTRKDTLKNHTQRVHEGLIESFPCNQCDFITNLESNLRRHTRGNHTQQAMGESHMCDYERCTYITLKKSELTTHIETKHEGIIRFRCEFMNCTFGTNKRKSLKEHTMRHTVKRHSKETFRCIFCAKTFMMKKHEQTHIRNIHSGVGRYKCDYLDCTFGTYDKRSLEAHVAKHTGVKLYQCNLCDHKFSMDWLKKRHIKKVHDNEMKLKVQNTKE